MVEPMAPESLNDTCSRVHSTEGHLSRQPHILLVINAEWYFWSHRRSLALLLQRRGYRVTVAAAVERVGVEAAIAAAGITLRSLKLHRRSMSPRTEVGTLRSLVQLYRRERPDLIHHFTIKPVIYGSIAARLSGITRVINTIPGRGFAFSGTGLRASLRRRAAATAYRAALCGRDTRAIFQNPEDLAWFVTNKIVPAARAALIRGSGVDTMEFTPHPEPRGVPVVLLASRLLWDKGVAEFVDAALALKRDGVVCRMVIVGIPDAENRRSVPAEKLRAWVKSGAIEWWGLRDHMADVIASSTVVVLPSYYPEGIPKILLEAAACGRPIVTTDSPGCREAVADGVNGLLIPARNSEALAAAIAQLLGNAELRREMGGRGRQMAEREFAESLVLTQTLDIYNELLPPMSELVPSPTRTVQ
jgi:glycosyltransferase involved in cell wall biosynthesis